jgi:DNA modification methylase
MKSKLNWLPSTRTCGCRGDAGNCLGPELWFKYQVPVWQFRKNEVYGDFERNSRKYHPAVFPRALVSRIIELFTHLGETVLDVFSGSGTTLIAAAELGRNAVGLELNPEYVKLGQRRLSYAKELHKHSRNSRTAKLNAVLFKADARDLMTLVPRNSIDCVITSPPYWDLLKQKQSLRNRLSGKHLKQNYSRDSRDLSNLPTLQSFTAEMNDVFFQIKYVLKPGGRFVLITGDYRRAGNYIPLHSIYINCLEDLGLKLNNMIIWDRSNEYEIGLFSYPRRFITANGMIEYVMEFAKN